MWEQIETYTVGSQQSATTGKVRQSRELGQAVDEVLYQLVSVSGHMKRRFLVVAYCECQTCLHLANMK